MPEELHGGFTHEFLEADIQRLAREIQEHRERPEARGAGEREIVRQSLRTLAPLPPVPFHQMDGEQSPLPEDLASAPPETKLEVEYLLDMAVHQGIDKAAAHASKSSPFVMDAFHDLLVDKLYPELRKRGIVK